MGAKILIVDDSVFMRNILKNILEKGHYSIAGEANNGNECIEKFKELKPDLITIDMIMPEMNGIDAVKKLVEINPGAKIIMVSAMGQQLLIEEALKAGAKNFIIKPFQPEKVLETIKTVLGEK